MWKVFSVVVNSRLNRVVQIYDALHGLRKGGVTGTVILEANLAQQIAKIAHEPLFHVLLDVHKNCDSLDRGRYLEILREYGMGPNLDRPLTHYCKQQRIVPNAGKFVGESSGMVRDVTQGNPASPMILNIVANTVMRAVL